MTDDEAVKYYFTKFPNREERPQFYPDAARSVNCGFKCMSHTNDGEAYTASNVAVIITEWEKKKEK